MESGKSGKNFVYYVSMGVTLVIVAWGLFAPASFAAAAKSIFSFLTDWYSWGYMLTMNSYVIFPIFLAFTRFGKLKLGSPESQPEFGNISWFAMLFSAGMAVGLVFYGIGEPITHYMNPPFGAAPSSEQAMRDAMRVSFYHWGLHPWAGYSVVALSLAYFQFRKGAPGLMSSMFLPWLGEKGADSPLGRAIDILAIFATAAGIATSLGLGVLQLVSGLHYFFNLPNYSLSLGEITLNSDLTYQVVIVLLLGLIYTWTAASGIEKGIKFVSNLNLILACFLLAALFFIGPTLSILKAFGMGVFDYFANLIQESFDIPFRASPYKSWMSGWTIYYWAWWIAWAPFVGSFIARISQGRTVREFVAGVLLVPAFGSFVWFAVFGTSGLHIEISGIAEIGKAVAADISTGIFEMYKYYPLGGFMSIVMMCLISTFFITSANSATFVLSMYSSEGNMNPPKVRMTVWGILQALLALVLLLTGGLQNLQIISIVAAAPFSIIMVLACWCLWKTLVNDAGSLMELEK
ncbi:MAG: BCCT family transporter [Synergistaceae bacterium]|jgi:glycine betaine transporter|nr:BCCT family transporter [Synergistaceae bacterium]